MPWSKPKDKEPPNQDDEYFLRNGGHKYIGWWDGVKSEFYLKSTHGFRMYLQKERHANIEWWDEEEHSQDVLWDEIREHLIEGWLDGDSAALVCSQLMLMYTLTRK